MEVNLSNITYPHVSVNIVNNSGLTSNVVEDYTGTVLNMPFVSDRGNDSDTITYGNWTNFTKLNGKPNFKRHGQPIYNIKRWLNNYGVVSGYRITPKEKILKNILPNDIPFSDDMVSKYANCFIVVKVNEDPVNKEVRVIVDVDSKTDYKNKKEQESLNYDNESLMYEEKTILLNHLLNYYETEEIILAGETEPRTFKVFPIVSFEANGSGSYGNQFSITLNLNNRYDDTFDYRLYDLGIYEKNSDGTMTQVNNFLVSFYPEAVSPAGSTYFIEKVVNLYANDYSCTFCEDKYNDLLYYLSTLNNKYFLKEDGQPVFDSIYDIDFIFGLTRGYGNVPYSSADLTNPIKFDIVNNVDDSLINVTSNDIKLSNGSDGCLATNYPNRGAILDLLYGAYYEGEFTPDVTDTTLFRTDVLLDAGFSNETKSKMSTLASIRKDCIAILDTGFLPGAISVKHWRERFDPNSEFSSIWSHSYSVYDDETRSNINVTSSYIFAELIPATDHNTGSIGTPFVGPNNGKFTGFNSINYVPTTVVDKQLLRDNRVNFVERDRTGYYYNNQLTSLNKETALSNVNNTRVLCRLVREINDLASLYRFKYATESELKTFEKDISTMLSNYISRGECRTASGVVSQTEYEKETNTCSVALNISFNDLLLNFNVTITVGR